MGFLDHFKKKEEPVFEGIEVQEEKGTLAQPIKGEVIPLAEIGDGIFSQGVLGKGCGLKPSGEAVYAPIGGTISTVADTKHAVGITGDNGTEVLIHVGIDTVDMNGKGFSVRVKAGDRVKSGQLLMTFSKAEIAKAGHPDTTAVLVTNSDEYEEISVLRTGVGEAGERMMMVK